MTWNGATAFAASRFIDAAREAIEMQEKAEEEATAAMDAYEHANAEVASATEVDAITVAVAKAHVAKWNADARRQMLAIIRETSEISAQASCAALLQLAKQLVASVKGAPAKWPPGRMVGSQPLRDIVWAARNQANHADEGNYSPELLGVFAKLEDEFGQAFHLESGLRQSRAREIAVLLGWLNGSTFTDDVESLLQVAT